MNKHPRWTQWTGLVAFFVSAASLPLCFMAVLYSSLRCDESCGYPPTSWTEDPGAWQWKGQAVIACAATLAAVYSLFTRRSPRSECALGIAIVGWFVWLLFGVAG